MPVMARLSPGISESSVSAISSWPPPDSTTSTPRSAGITVLRSLFQFCRWLISTTVVAPAARAAFTWPCTTVAIDSRFCGSVAPAL